MKRNPFQTAREFLDTETDAAAKEAVLSQSSCADVTGYATLAYSGTLFYGRMVGKKIEDMVISDPAVTGMVEPADIVTISQKASAIVAVSDAIDELEYYRNP